MQVDLFPSAVTDSPRAAWHRKYGLLTREYYAPHQHGNSRWICANTAMTRVVVKDTEDAAEQEYCALFGITWWKLADWNGAMESKPGIYFVREELVTESESSVRESLVEASSCEEARKKFEITQP